jgi:putative tryptophan/tyrosine transport system substrate-binding protein
VKRREFITLFGGVMAAWPLAARAQQAAMPVIGILEAGGAELSPGNATAFRKGLSETGYTEGQTIAIEYRWAEYERLPELAAELVRRRAAVIITPFSVAATLAARAATTTVPIVFSTGADPVETGLVASLNRPGGNVTGAVTMNAELAAKRFGLLQELFPTATRFAVLVNSATGRVANAVTADVQAAAASATGRQVEVLTASTSREIDTAFATVVQKRIDALLHSPDPFFTTRRAQIIVLASRHAVPVIYANREDAVAGGLMSYGSSIVDVSRQLGIYTGRILKGEKPADMPVLRATKFEFVINMHTARTFGLDIPPTLLARADEVIE